MQSTLHNFFGLRKLNLILCLCSINFLFSQKVEIDPVVKVVYESILKLGLKNNTQKQTFVLIGNSKDYYFGAYQNYLNDTQQYISSKGLDFQIISDEFPERVIYKDNNFDVLFSLNDNKIRYKESGNLKWILYKEIKIINGLKCQMASTNKYGRRWIAFFSKDYIQNIGPYKFFGLPGLIVELYDTRKDYYFKAVAIEKYNISFKYNTSGYKNFSKKDYLKAKENMEFGINKYPAMSGEMRKETVEMLIKLKEMSNNPLELNPYD